MVLPQVAYRGPPVRGLILSPFKNPAHRSSVREYCLSSASAYWLGKEMIPVEGQYMLRRAIMQTIAEKRQLMIIKIGDLKELLKERIILSDLRSVPIISTPMVILYLLNSDSTVNIEDVFENATGFDLSSLLAIILDNLVS